MSTPQISLEVLTDPPDPALIDRVGEELLDGGVAVLPTDTLYGLCAAAESERGLVRVFEIKGRNPAIALPVFVGNLSQARAIAEFNAGAERLASRFWPGPLTLVLKRRQGIDWDLGGDNSTIGIRWPNSRFLSELCERAGPVTATSANLSGSPAASTVTEAVAMFGSQIDIYVDGGPSPTSTPSTVVRLIGDPEILRGGLISASDILSLLR